MSDESRLRKELKAIFESVKYGEYGWDDAFDIIEQMIETVALIPAKPSGWYVCECGHLCDSEAEANAHHSMTGHSLKPETPTAKPPTPPVVKRWRCTKCGLYLEGEGVVMPTGIRKHKIEDSFWCGPVVVTPSFTEGEEEFHSSPFPNRCTKCKRKNIPLNEQWDGGHGPDTDWCGPVVAVDKEG
jgi:hypothetical protein